MFFLFYEECVEKSLTRVFHEFCCEIVMNNLHLTIPAKIFLNWVLYRTDAVFFYFRYIFQALEHDPKLKFICLPCHDTLDVACDFKQKCDKSMAASRQKIAKLVFKCKTCPMAFETANELEKHMGVTHSIDLTEDDQPDVAPPKRTGPKNGKNKSKQQLIIGGSKMRFKIPMRSSKKQTGTSKKGKNSSKKETKHKPTSQHSSASQQPATDFKCPICKHQFANRAGLVNHINWHDRKQLQYKCPSCSLMFLQKIHMDKHIRQKH